MSNRFRKFLPILIAIFAVGALGSATSASSPTTRLTPNGASVQATTLTSGETIQVRHEEAQRCYSLVKSVDRIGVDFGVNPNKVKIQDWSCSASFVSNTTPHVRFPYRNAIAGSPGYVRTWSRGQFCCRSNELQMLWNDRPEGFHTVGLPPRADIQNRRDLALFLTGIGDPFCLTKVEDRSTGQKFYRYGKQCEAISFVVPEGWSVNDELTDDLAPFRDAGSLVTSKKFTFIRDRTIFGRWLNSK